MNRYTTERVEIRLAQEGDDSALRRVAQRDSASLPQAPLLLGIVGGEIQAAVSLRTGAVIADPFAPTARLVELLQLQTGPRRTKSNGNQFRVFRFRGVTPIQYIRP